MSEPALHSFTGKAIPDKQLLCSPGGQALGTACHCMVYFLLWWRAASEPSEVTIVQVARDEPGMSRRPSSELSSNEVSDSCRSSPCRVQNA